MEFDGTPLNMTTLLVVVLAVVSLTFTFRKRYESNVPILFYIVAVIFSNATDRTVNPILLYGGFAFTLLLRFEFMNAALSKVCAFCAACSTALIIFVFLTEVFGDGQMPF